MRVKSLEKYWSVFSISFQQEITHRASFLMDRARSITIVVAFYAFWSAIFQNRSDLLGYSKSKMFTYVLGMNVLRALVFSDKTWEIIREINVGKISSYLIRPISYIGFSLSRDAVDKLTNLVSSLIEVSLAVWILSIPLYHPQRPATCALFSLSVILAILLYFLMSYAVSALAFWTAESGGPRFCFELFLEFAAGAFFPLDVLPPVLKQSFQFLPFASLLYFPLSIFLERASVAILVQGFLVQIFWIAVMGFLTRFIWTRGLRIYSAQGG